MPPTTSPPHLKSPKSFLCQGCKWRLAKIGLKSRLPLVLAVVGCPLFGYAVLIARSGDGEAVFVARCRDTAALDFDFASAAPAAEFVFDGVVVCVVPAVPNCRAVPVAPDYDFASAAGAEDCCFAPVGDFGSAYAALALNCIFDKLY